MKEPALRVLRPSIGVFVALGIGVGLYPILSADHDGLAGRLELLRSGPTSARQRVAEELGTGNEPDVATVLTGLVAALNDADTGVRSRAAHSLGRNLVLHPNTDKRKTARAALIQSLGDRDGSVRGSSAIALAMIGDESETLVAGLIDALRGNDPLLRGEAQASLASFGVKSDVRLRTLLGLLREDQAAVRDAAAHLLAQVGPGPEPAARTHLVLTALTVQQPQARRVAASVLGRVGQGRPEAGSALARMLSDEDAGVRASAAGALAAFGDDPQVRESLWRALHEDDDVEVRVNAASSLCSGRRPAPAEALTRLAEELRQIGDHVELADALASGLADPTPRLIAALSEADPRVREAVARTVGLTAPKPEASAQVVAALVPLLRDPTPGVGIAAAEALGRLGKAARSAIPALHDTTLHPDRSLSAFAVAVLKRLDPPVSRGD